MSPSCAATSKTAASQIYLRRMLLPSSPYNKSTPRISLVSSSFHRPPDGARRSSSSQVITPQFSAYTLRPRKSAQFRIPNNTPSKHILRRISHNPPLQGTIAIQNPRRDADGKEMSISITPRASQVTSVSPSYFFLLPEELTFPFPTLPNSDYKRSWRASTIPNSSCGST